MSIRNAISSLALCTLGLACGSSPPLADQGAPPDLLSVDHLLADQRSLDHQAREAGRSAQCLAQDTKLQVALDAARKSPNAMLGVRNAGCGTSVYLSGDPANATAASLWRVGSVSKTYVSATVLALVATGKLGLDDLLSKWVPGVAQSEGVTLRMLLNHTSGVFNYTDDPSFGKEPKREWKPSELVALATKHDPYFKPGAGWEYSNTNYVLLGMVLEAAGAAKASALIRQHALVPAGLTHTFLEGEETLTGKVATGFDAKKNDVTYAYSMSGPWTAGAMVASGADLCDWVATLYGETKVLDEARRRLLTEGAIVTSVVSKYGLGVELLDASITAGAGPALGHGGAVYGSYTQAYWFADKQTAICSVVNQDGQSANDITLAALIALFK